MRRSRFVVFALALLLSPLASIGQRVDRDDRLLDALINNLTHSDRYIRTQALKSLGDMGRPEAIPALIELIRFDVPFDTPLIPVLERLAGVQLGSEWSAWVEWLQQHDEVKPHGGFLAWESGLFSRLDPAFTTLLSPGLPYCIRVEEIAWGGVRKDGIPALTNPTHIAPDKATDLTPQELVFGVSINNDHRAYPLRILDWHEMFNDVVGGKLVTLAY